MATYIKQTDGTVQEQTHVTIKRTGGTTAVSGLWVKVSAGVVLIWRAISNCITGGWWQHGHGWEHGTGWGQNSK